MIARDRCPICAQGPALLFSWPFRSAELARVLDRVGEDLAKRLNGERYEILRCTECDFSFQRIVPDDEEVRGLYALYADEDSIRAEIAAQELHWLAHVTEEILVMRQLVRSSRPRALDFGCNWGKWASMALAFGCDVDAVEVNAVAAAFCSSRGIRMVEASRLPLGYYHFINVDQVLEHVADPIALARRLASCLAPDGYMKWSTPRDERLLAKLRQASRNRDGSILRSKWIDPLEPMIHLNLFTNGSLRKLGQRAGLQIVRLPFFTWLGAGQLWNLPRQIGRNLTVPRKRWLGRGTYLWFSREPQAVPRP